MTHLIYNSTQNVEYTRPQLAQIATPAALGRFHLPFSFDDYVGSIHHGLELAGIEVIEEEYVTSHENQRLFGAIAIRPQPLEGEYIAASDYKFVLGLRGSHDQSVTRGITLGTQVLVCSNLCFNGDLGTLNTKQTLNIGSRLPSLIRQAIDLIPGEAAKTALQFQKYRQFVFQNPRHGDAALVEIHRRGGLSAAQLGKAVAEWDRPSHEEHTEGGFTAWRLLNACTEAIKPTGAQSNPALVEQRTTAVSSFLNEFIH